MKVLAFGLGVRSIKIHKTGERLDIHALSALAILQDYA